jgi:hypothetical protein
MQWITDRIVIRSIGVRSYPRICHVWLNISRLTIESEARFTRGDCRQEHPETKAMQRRLIEDPGSWAPQAEITREAAIMLKVCGDRSCSG